MQRFLTLIFPLVALALVGCRPTPPPPVYTDPVTVSKLARLPIPPSATNVMCRTDRDDNRGWLDLPQPDHRYWGRFDIPAADLPLVLAGMPKDQKVKPHTGDSDLTSHPPKEAWWHIERLRNPREAEWSVPGYSFNLLFGESGADGMLTVYFFNFEL